MEPAPVNTIEQPAPYSRTAWWREHKDDPRIIECMREARRKYYYKNQEREKQRGREYYRKRKALLNPPVTGDPQNPEPPTGV